MKNLKLDVIGMYMSGENRHPQQLMSDLGMKYQHSTPQSICDSWWFWNCENIPNELPEYISELKSNPMDCIGYGLSEENAIAIRDYKNK